MSTELSRQNALAEALRVDDATVGTNISAVNLHFNTEEEKRAGMVKAFTELTVKYHGSQEEIGGVAQTDEGLPDARPGLSRYVRERAVSRNRQHHQQRPGNRRVKHANQPHR